MGTQNKKVLVDGHTHTRMSDGKSKLASLILAAKERGIEWLTVTDHDDCRALSVENISNPESGFPALRQVSRASFDYQNMEVVRGIELSCNDSGKTVHILGIGINEPDAEMSHKLSASRSKRKQRFVTMVDKVNALPDIMEREIHLDAEQILVEVVDDGVASRLHLGYAISRALAALPKSRRETITPMMAVERYLRPGSNAYISLYDSVFPSPKEGIESILRMGGLPILPHLIELVKHNFGVAEKICEYARYGLVGFEVISGRRSLTAVESNYGWLFFHSKVTELTVTIPKKFPDMTALNGMRLVPFFGSDFHGDYIPERQLGIEVYRRHLRKIRYAYSLITR